MFNSTINIVAVRMFEVKIRYCENLNVAITNNLIENDTGLYKALCLSTVTKEGEVINFFSPEKDYPVLEHMYKSSMISSEVQKSNILRSAPEAPTFSYNESNFLVIPDNFGYIRSVGIHDLILSSYEVPNSKRRKRMDVTIVDISLEPSNVVLPMPKEKEDEKSGGGNN